MEQLGTEAGATPDCSEAAGATEAGADQDNRGEEGELDAAQPPRPLRHGSAQRRAVCVQGELRNAAVVVVAQ